MSIQLLDHADTVRLEVSPRLSVKRKSQLGQFMTPAAVARFMANMFPASTLQSCNLLDAGAGVGSLSCAFLDRWSAGDGFTFDQVEMQAYEIDTDLRDHLTATLQSYAERLPVSVSISDHDFIEAGAIKGLQGSRRFTHAILNPPYKKINSGSDHRRILRRAGIETVNLYTAFVALAVELMAPGGQVVAIIPRSFCNGPYYRPFREFILQRCALQQIHLFGSRTKAFKDDAVLQENVIIRLERGAKQGDVEVTNAPDATFAGMTSHRHEFERIVFPNDPEKFIHVPLSAERGLIETAAIQSTLQELGIAVSTGPVVDFRMRHDIVPMPEAGTVPLLYSGHFIGQETHWPKPGIKKGNALRLTPYTQKWLYPTGFYTVVRRFSAKEERRRLVAGIARPDAFDGAEMLGFENHLNVFHDQKHGLDENLAYGLAAFLNTTAVDDHFRRFNGHTQVNATDLRLMRYPTRAALIAFGKWAKKHKALTQEMLDERLETMLK